MVILLPLTVCRRVAAAPGRGSVGPAAARHRPAPPGMAVGRQGWQIRLGRCGEAVPPCGRPRRCRPSGGAAMVRMSSGCLRTRRRPSIKQDGPLSCGAVRVLPCPPGQSPAGPPDRPPGPCDGLRARSKSFRIPGYQNRRPAVNRVDAAADPSPLARPTGGRVAGPVACQSGAGPTDPPSRNSIGRKVCSPSVLVPSMARTRVSASGSQLSDSGERVTVSGG